MIDLNAIRSLTDFKRKTPEYIAELKRSGRPQVLTVNGRAEIVVQDAAAYQRLLEALDLAQAVAGIREGLADLERGDVADADVTVATARRALASSR